MAKRRQNRKRLDLWQERLSISAAAAAGEAERMDHRDALYRGTHEMFPFTEKTKRFRAGERAYGDIYQNTCCKSISCILFLRQVFELYYLNWVSPIFCHI